MWYSGSRPKPPAGAQTLPEETDIATLPDHACDLCTLPVRTDRFSEAFTDRRYHFCCAGCQMVFTMLMAASDTPDPATFRESDLFRQCVAAGVVPASETDLARCSVAADDDPPPEAEATGGAATLVLETPVQGMWCPACAWVIGTALNRIDGIASARCDFSTDRLRCRYDPVKVTPGQIRERVAGLGYQLPPGNAEAAGAARRGEFVRLALSALLSANVMMLSWALYSGYFTTLTDSDIRYISWPIFIMATIVIVYGGGPIARKAWAGLRHGAPGMEALIVLGAGSAYCYSLYNWWTGTLSLYFDTAAMLITLLLLGKLLESRAKARVRRDLEGFMALLPTKVNVQSDAFPQGRYVAVEQLRNGDRFLLGPDEVAPADGRVADGRGRLDASAVTGEPKPLSVREGDAVTSGSRLLDGRLLIRADAVGRAALLGQMVEVVRQGLARPTGLESRTDRWLRLFVPLIAGLAAGTGIVAGLLGLPADQALVRTVTVLVIACPCALGIAVPLARVAGIAGAGRQGLLVRNASAFEQAGRATAVVMDKTGTITQGRWRLTHIETLAPWSEAHIMALAAGLEGETDHPVSLALRQEARRRGIAPLPVQNTRGHAEGISGIYDGRHVKIGSRRFALSGTASPADHERRNGGIRPGQSEVVLSVEGTIAARFYFGDTVREGVTQLVADLSARGITVHLLSGDDERATEAVAAAVGIAKAQGRLLPIDKAAYISRLQQTGAQVIMVGDGVNDAPALARADLGLAVHTGAPLARQTAGVTLMRGEPCQLIDFLDWAARVDGVVRWNLWGALAYNLISIPVAMSGLLTPLVAVSAMLLSSLTVIGNTLRLVHRR